MYEMGESCAKMQFSCPVFQLGKGDTLFVKTKRNKKFKKLKFKTQTYAGDMTVRFRSNKKKNGIGAQCTMECIKDAATTTEAPTTPFTEPTTTTVCGSVNTFVDSWTGNVKGQLEIPTSEDISAYTITLK